MKIATEFSAYNTSRIIYFCSCEFQQVSNVVQINFKFVFLFGRKNSDLGSIFNVGANMWILPVLQ